jgi:hypothetical protein
MDDLPGSPRIVVIGTSAAGKTTLAHALSQSLAVPMIELDELFWSAGWQPKPTEEFLELVRQAATGESWVAAGNYRVARPVLWQRANVVVWLNYSLPVVFRRGLVRTLRRWWTGELLWHGNKESFRRTFLSRESILLWILTTHARKTRQFRELQKDPQYAEIRWIAFRRPAEASAWAARQVRRAV